MNCDTITYICVIFVIGIALCIFLFCLGYRSSGAMSLDKTTLDSDPELHFGNLHLVDRDESEEQLSKGGKVLDLDDFINPDLLDDEDDGVIDRYTEMTIRLAKEEDPHDLVHRMLEKTGKILALITRINETLKLGVEDESTETLLESLMEHLHAEMQDCHDVVEATNLYVGDKSDFMDEVIEIENALAEVEGYNL